MPEALRQLRECVTFIEDTFHRPFNWERLKEIMANTKVSTTLRKEAMELGKNIPSPTTFFDMASALGGVNYLLGKPQCIEVYQAIKDEAAERVQKKEGAVIGERYRLYWDGIMCWPKLGHTVHPVGVSLLHATPYAESISMKAWSRVRVPSRETTSCSVSIIRWGTPAPLSMSLRYG